MTGREELEGRQEIRVLACGDRNWGIAPGPAPGVSYGTLEALRARAKTEQDVLYGYLDDLHSEFFIVCIIEGEAAGADKLARKWAEDRHVPFEPYPALWHEWGKAAGPIRNQQMLDEGCPDYVVGFHNDIQTSRGTRNMILKARKANLPHDVVAAF